MQRLDMDLVRKVVSSMIRQAGMTPCKICGMRPHDQVDSFEVCVKCRPEFEQDLDAWIDAQIEAKLLEEAEDE